VTAAQDRRHHLAGSYLAASPGPGTMPLPAVSHLSPFTPRPGRTVSAFAGSTSGHRRDLAGRTPARHAGGAPCEHPRPG